MWLISCSGVMVIVKFLWCVFVWVIFYVLYDWRNVFGVGIYIIQVFVKLLQYQDIDWCNIGCVDMGSYKVDEVCFVEYYYLSFNIVFF